jgi:hypothetical protein
LKEYRTRPWAVANSRGNQPHLRVVRQGGSALRATIPQIAQGDAALHALEQRQGGFTVIPVAWRQDEIADAPINVAEKRQFEAEEPPLASFPPLRPCVPQQSHPPMPDGLTEQNGCTINQIQAGGGGDGPPGGGQQSPDVSQQAVHPGDPRLVGGQVGKGSVPVARDQPRGLFEGGDLQHPLEQDNRQHFGIGGAGRGASDATRPRGAGL